MVPPGELYTFPPDMFTGPESHLPAWAVERLTPQPFMYLDRPFALSTNAAEKLPRTYLAATVGVPEEWRETAHEPFRKPPWRYREFDGDHEVLLTDPELLTSVLLDVVPRST